MFEILTSVVPYVVVSVLMYLTLGVSDLLTLVLILAVWLSWKLVWRNRAEKTGDGAAVLGAVGLLERAPYERQTPKK